MHRGRGSSARFFSFDTEALRLPCKPRVQKSREGFRSNRLEPWFVHHDSNLKGTLVHVGIGRLLESRARDFSRPELHFASPVVSRCSRDDKTSDA